VIFISGLTYFTKRHSITAIDTEGMALAAILGLDKKLPHTSKAKGREIPELKP